MGEVFRAVDTRLGRPVAIKLAHEQFSARFEREARAISSLNHPNICTLYDVGPNYLVMELVQGETLSGPAEERTPFVKDGAPLCLANRGCAGGGPRQGNHSPRFEAVQHHDREIRREGSGFRRRNRARTKPSQPATW
jgi:hypothetical protein